MPVLNFFHVNCHNEYINISTQDNNDDNVKSPNDVFYLDKKLRSSLIYSSIMCSVSDLVISFFEGVQNKLLNVDDSIYIPVTRAEYTVLISAFNVRYISLSLSLCLSECVRGCIICVWVLCGWLQGRAW